MRFNSIDIIRDVHRCVAPDVDLSSVADQHDDLIKLEFPETSPKNLGHLCSIKTGAYSEIAILLNCLLVRKPHSADVFISAYNKLKTQERSLSRSTLSNYSYVHINMPKLCNFIPRPAVYKWIN